MGTRQRTEMVASTYQFGCFCLRLVIDDVGHAGDLVRHILAGFNGDRFALTRLLREYRAANSSHQRREYVQHIHFGPLLYNHCPQPPPGVTFSTSSTPRCVAPRTSPHPLSSPLRTAARPPSASASPAHRSSRSLGTVQVTPPYGTRGRPDLTGKTAQGTSFFFFCTD